MKQKPDVLIEEDRVEVKFGESSTAAWCGEFCCRKYLAILKPSHHLQCASFLYTVTLLSPPPPSCSCTNYVLTSWFLCQLRETARFFPVLVPKLVYFTVIEVKYNQHKGNTLYCVVWCFFHVCFVQVTTCGAPDALTHLGACTFLLLSHLNGSHSKYQWKSERTEACQRFGSTKQCSKLSLMVKTSQHPWGLYTVGTETYHMGLFLTSK